MGGFVGVRISAAGQTEWQLPLTGESCPQGNEERVAGSALGHGGNGNRQEWTT